MTSTSRRRRSGASTLLTGDTVRGQIRLPKQSERYFALARVDSGQRQGARRPARKRKPFDRLTPLYPEERLRCEMSGTTTSPVACWT